MAMFSKKFNFKTDALPKHGNRHSHCENIGVPGKVQVRSVEMGEQGTTVVFLPALDFEEPDHDPKNPKVLDDRLSDDPSDLSPWIFMGPGVFKIGKFPNQQTIFFDNPDDAGYNQAEEHPIDLIYSAAQRTHKAQTVIDTPFGSSESDDWNLLFKGDGAKNFAVIKKPGRIGVAHVLMYQSGRDNFVAEGGLPLGGAANEPPVLLVMPSSAVEAMVEKICEPINNDDPYVLRHPVITGTKFVHFFDRNKGVCQAKTNADMARAAASSSLGGVRRAPSAYTPASNKPEIGYGVYVSDTSDGRKDGLTVKRPDIERLAKKVLSPWSKTIRGVTPEKCAQLMIEKSGLPLSLLWYAWKSRPEFYSDEMRAKRVSRTSAVVPPNQNADFGGTDEGQQKADDTPKEERTDGFLGAVPDFDGDDQGNAETNPSGEAPWGGNIHDKPAPVGDDGLYDPSVRAAARKKMQDAIRNNARPNG